MPCNNGNGIAYGPQEERPTKEELKAALCGILTAVESSRGKLVLDSVDWKEAGVNPKVIFDWWEKHKKQDKKRRKGK